MAQFPRCAAPLRRKSDPDYIRCPSHGIGVGVGVAGRSLHLGVTEQLTDHVQALAGGDRCRRECVVTLGADTTKGKRG